jgi:glycosyltransferase involved in cell wall biosynthesis
MSENSKVDFSIVIPSFMSKEFLDKTILEILTYTNVSKYQYEVIIVVDGSLDGSWEEGCKNFRRK